MENLYFLIEINFFFIEKWYEIICWYLIYIKIDKFYNDGFQYLLFIYKIE